MLQTLKGKGREAVGMMKMFDFHCDIEFRECQLGQAGDFYLIIFTEAWLCSLSSSVTSTLFGGSVSQQVQNVIITLHFG